MKNMLSSAKSFLCMVLCLMGVTAYAQETVKLGETEIPVVHTQTIGVDVLEKAAYTADTAVFNVDAIVEALGIDSIAVAAKYIVNVTTSECVEDNDPFYDGWRNEVGDAALWSSGDHLVCVKINEPETGIIDYVATKDEGWLAGEEYTALWGFVANEKAAIVKVVVHFVENPNAVPEVELPDPELTIANLEIVGTAEVTGERYYTQGYETSDFSLVVADIAEKLGISNENLGYAFDRMIYVNQKSEGLGTGVLDLLDETDGWLGRIFNEDVEETDEVCGDYHANNPDFYIHDMAYDSETTTVSFVMGQMPGKFTEEAVRYVNLYVVYGSKAYIIKFTVNFIAPEFSGLEGMTKVGEEIVEVSMSVNNDYGYTTFTLDLEAIAQLLGAEDTKDIQMQGLTDNGYLSTEHTADRGGWWLTQAGAVTAWATGTFFVEPEIEDTWDLFHVGQKPNQCREGDEYETKLYLIFGEKYYEVTVKLTIGERAPVVDPEVELEVVATRVVNISAECDHEEAWYRWSEGVVIPNEYLEEVIGTTDVLLLGEEVDLTPEDEHFYTDAYSCDPKPGFWLTADGKVTTWGNSSVWGMSIVFESADEGLVVNCIQMPNMTAIGDVYTGNIYLANSETGKMLQVNIIYNIVATVEDIEVVGEDNAVLAASEDETGIDVNAAAIAESLGFESVDEMVCTPCLRAMTKLGVFGVAETPETGLALDIEGYPVDLDDDENKVVGLYFNGDKLTSYLNASVPEDWMVTTTICLENAGKRYVITLTLGTPDVLDGITSVSANSSSKVYDLQGREVVKAQKGIFIQNGKAVVK